MSGMDDNVCCVDALFREDRCIKVVDLAQELDISWASACHIIQDQLDYRKVYACWLSKSLTDDHKAHCARLCSQTFDELC
jgi:hypothetical protein